MARSRSTPFPRLAMAVTTSVASVAMALTALAPPALAGELQGQVFSESFDDLADWRVLGGQWSATSGSARSSGALTSRHRLALPGYRLQDDARVAAVIRLTGTGEPTASGILHTQSQNDTHDFNASGYSAVLRRNGNLALVKAQNGGPVAFLGEVPSGTRPVDGPVTVYVRFVGDLVQAGVGNGSPLISAADTTFRGGGVSLLGNKTTVAVDSIRLSRTTPAVEPDRGPVFLSDQRLTGLRDRIERRANPQAGAYAALLTEVATDATRTPDPPETWFIPPFYQGPEAQTAARERLMNDANAAYRLALAFRLSGSTSYGVKAAEFIDAWAQEGPSSFSTESDSTLAFSYHLPAMVFAAEMLRGTAVWPAEDEAAFARWIRQRLDLASDTGRTQGNNWVNWGIALKMSIGAYLGDENLVAASAAQLRSLLNYQIDANGHLPEEVYRNTGEGELGIWYSHFTLFPTVLAAEIAGRNGIDLYAHRTPRGKTIEDAVEATAGWVENPGSFPYGDAPVSSYKNWLTIDSYEARGYTAHAMSYYEIVADRFDSPVIDRLLTRERQMTTVHSAPDLTLTHACGVCEPVGAAG